MTFLYAALQASPQTDFNSLTLGSIDSIDFYMFSNHQLDVPGPVFIYVWVSIIVYIW